MPKILLILCKLIKKITISAFKLNYDIFLLTNCLGQYEREKKIQLANSSLEKDFKGLRHATILIKWEGPSLAAGINRLIHKAHS